MYTKDHKTPGAVYQYSYHLTSLSVIVNQISLYCRMNAALIRDGLTLKYAREGSLLVGNI